MVSVSIGEDELRALPTDDMVGHYSAWNYFQSLNRNENLEFVRNFQKRYGTDRVTSDVIEAAYFSVHLWAQATSRVRLCRGRRHSQGIAGTELQRSRGRDLHRSGHATYLAVVFDLAKILPNRQFDVVWTSGSHPARAVPAFQVQGPSGMCFCRTCSPVG